MKFLDNWRMHSFVHMCWIIFILITLVIFLLSWKIGPNESVKDILNFAISFTSLVLAVFAIAQALISSSSLPDAVASVREGISDVKRVAHELSETTCIITAHSKNIEDNSLSISDSISFFEGNQTNTDSRPRNPRGIDDIDFSENLLETASPVFYMALYVILMSYKTKKDYVTSDLTGSWDRTLNIVGVISALSGIGVIDTSSSSEGDTRYVTNLGGLNWLEDREAKLLIPRSEIDKEYFDLVLDSVKKYFS